LLDASDMVRGILALLAQTPEPGLLRTWDLQSGPAPHKCELVRAYATHRRRPAIQVWLPRTLAMAAAWLLEGAGRMRGVRRHLPYRLARAYRPEPEKRPFKDFWHDVGIRPHGSMESCLAIAVMDTDTEASLSEPETVRA
jgi:hypothetical protein